VEFGRVCLVTLTSDRAVRQLLRPNSVASRHSYASGPHRLLAEPLILSDFSNYGALELLAWLCLRCLSKNMRTIDCTFGPPTV
jgi:hypothetical protein